MAKSLPLSLAGTSGKPAAAAADSLLGHFTADPQYGDPVLRQHPFDRFPGVARRTLDFLAPPLDQHLHNPLNSSFPYRPTAS